MHLHHRLAAGCALALLCLVGGTSSATADSPADGAEAGREAYALLPPEEFFRLSVLEERIDFADIDYGLLQAAVFHLTNRERAEAGREPLQYHPALEAAAHGHSMAMRDHGFYSHRSPVSDRRTVRRRVEAEGVVPGWVGENIAIVPGINYEHGRGVYNPHQNGGYFSYTYRGDPILPRTYLSAAREVVEAWMGSPGHRRNMLREEYSHLGVGAAHFRDASFYDMDNFYFTQNFAGRVR